MHDIDIGNISLYGVDPDGPVASTERDNTVSVPESIIQLTDNQTDDIKCLVSDPLADDGNHRIGHYLAIANYLINSTVSNLKNDSNRSANRHIV